MTLIRHGGIVQRTAPELSEGFKALGVKISNIVDIVSVGSDSATIVLFQDCADESEGIVSQHGMLVESNVATDDARQLSSKKYAELDEGTKRAKAQLMTIARITFLRNRTKRPSLRGFYGRILNQIEPNQNVPPSAQQGNTTAQTIAPTDTIIQMETDGSDRSSSDESIDELPVQSFAPPPNRGEGAFSHDTVILDDTSNGADNQRPPTRNRSPLAPPDTKRARLSSPEAASSSSHQGPDVATASL